ncbi:MAG: 16S rRNA (uracil(1498)-N(3))-methyltransferase [Candidatus Nanopelagicales bacterium]
MTPALFVIAESDFAQLTVGSTYTLAGDEGRHAVSVRRLNAGEKLWLTDGVGNVAVGAVLSTQGKDRLTVEVCSLVTEQPASPSVTVVQALIKGDRMERAVEAMTEAGVDRIVVWVAAKSIARWRVEQVSKAMTKLRRRIVEASKQSRRRHFPELSGPVDTAALAAGLGDGSLVPGSGQVLVLVLDEQAQETIADVDFSLANRIVLVVGPEGGVAATERAQLAAAGARLVQMGPTVMRASTAGTVALGAVMAAAGRWAPPDISNVPD